MNGMETRVRESAYSCIDDWKINIYPGLFSKTGTLREGVADEVLLAFSDIFDKAMFSKIEKTVDGNFIWESAEVKEKASPNLKVLYLPLPDFSSEINGEKIIIKTRINLCINNSTHTKITTIIELEKNIGMEEIINLIPLLEEKVRINNLCYAGIYKDFAMKKYGVSFDEERPLYKVSLMSFGMDNKTAKDVIMSSKSSKKLIRLTEENDHATQILNEISILEENFIKTDAQEWRVKTLIGHEDSNTLVDGKDSIIGTYGIYKLSKETYFLNFVFGNERQTHAVTRDIVLDFINEL